MPPQEICGNVIWMGHLEVIKPQLCGFCVIDQVGNQIGAKGFKIPYSTTLVAEVVAMR